MSSPSPEPYLILTPVYNDWESWSILLDELDKVMDKENVEVQVLAVDDGSPEPLPPDLLKGVEYKAISQINVLHLSRNLGHQKALTLGLAHIWEHRSPRAVMIMDADGEDTPEEGLRLLRKFEEEGEDKIVFAERSRRSEGCLFQFCYFVYRKLFSVATGFQLKFGNFSVVPRSSIDRMVTLSELWSHYPSAVIKSRLAFTTLPTSRGRRFKGESKMNFISLIKHGLHSLAIHGDMVGVRALVACGMLSVFAFFMIGVVVSVKFFTDLAIQGWASYLVASFLILLTQSIMLSLLFVFSVLHSENPNNFIPRRDYHHFILSEERFHPND